MIVNILKSSLTMMPNPIRKYLGDIYRYSTLSINNAQGINNIKIPRKHSSVCVLGNGPSLQQDKAIIKEIISNHDFVCVNNFCDDDLYNIIKPTAYVFLDEYFFSPKAHLDWIRRREITFQKINNETTWPMTIILPYNADLSIIKAHIHNPNIQIIKISTQNLYIKKYSRVVKLLFDIGIYGPPQINVLIYAIFICIGAKYENIKIFGADLSFHNDINVNQETNELYIRFRHFNEEDKIELLKKNPEKVENFRMSEILDLSAQTFYAHEILYSYARDKNIVIVNYSNYSLIDAYPRSES